MVGLPLSQGHFSSKYSKAPDVPDDFDRKSWLLLYFVTNLLARFFLLFILAIKNRMIEPDSDPHSGRTDGSRAARWLYQIGVGVYYTLLRSAAPFHPKARQMCDGRRRWQPALQAAMAKGSGPLTWWHCASLGEFEQARPVLEGYRAAHPDHRVLLTFFSPSGYEVRKNYAGADHVMYLPFDHPANVRDFMALAQPSRAFFVKYEFWYGYLAALRDARVPTVLFSAAFRPEQPFFRPYGQFFRQMLQGFTHIFVQDEASAQLLRQIGCLAITVAGDTRYDRVSATAAAATPIPLARDFVGTHPVLVVGSSWPEDHRVLVPFLNSFHAPLKVIIAPHEIRPAVLADLEQQLQRRTVRFSQATPESAAAAEVLLIDNVGMLAALYRYGHLAWIGGAYRTGLHNSLEAAAFGMPLFFGDRAYDKFPEAAELIAAGIALAIPDSEALRTHFQYLYDRPAQRQAIAKRAAAFVADRRGATDLILRTLF